MTIVGLIAGYLGFVGFVLALLTVAKRSDEAAERQARAVATRRRPLRRQARAVATRRRPLRRPQGAVRDAGLSPDDAEFFEGLDRRAAREFERRRFVRHPTPRKKAPRDS